MDRDALTTLDPRKVAKSGLEVVDKLSDHPPAIQVHTLTVLFRLLVERHGLDVREELERTDRLIRDGDGNLKPEVGALRAYLHGEIK